MRLPKNLLNRGTYTKPRIFLCEVDKTRIAELEVIGLQGSFKFNSFSELTFEVPRVYSNITTGETKINLHYNRIEALRLIYLENFGYFELQGVELISDGIKESKSCTAYSLEYTLAQKYLDKFYINTGGTDSIEVMNAADQKSIKPISLLNKNNTKLSLLHLILEKAYGWKIGHVDVQLQTLSRKFEVDRESIYDFIINEICEKFNCYAVFDTVNNTINLYAESPTAKFIGDGSTRIFEIGSKYADEPLFSSVQTVSINGYKTTRWTYGVINNVGILTLEEAPDDDAKIEVVGVDSTWETNVFITFDNLAQEVNVNYDSDEIKTCLKVTYGDDFNINDVNLGQPSLTDLSYYHTVDWMGQDLYDAYSKYLDKCNNYQSDYSINTKEILKINDKIYYEEYRLSLEYSLASSVHSKTVGTYYVRVQNSDGSYYYSQVSLPNEYKAGTDYYSNATTNLNETKVDALYDVLKKYFYAHYNAKPEDKQKALDELDALSDSFKFMKNHSIEYLHNGLNSSNKETAIYKFLGEMWKEIGVVPLEKLYLAPYKNIKTTNETAGWSQPTHNLYGYYYTVVLFVNSLNSEIADRKPIIENYNIEKAKFEKSNTTIVKTLEMANNFNESQLIRLNAFMREDELHLDDIIETSQDNVTSSFKIKQDAMESGRIELKKRSQPQLQFSMDMANIYAIPEFEPIIDQFQLGRIIKVSLRPDYIKQSRLLQVDVNFEDFSDFSVEFGELTSLRSQSDIHADLLSKAISAGKSVATNSSYWSRGSDTATATDLKIQQGLLDATTQIKAIDGEQGIIIDKYGIKLQKKNDDGSIDPHQTWMTNNMILMSDDGFKTSRSALGHITVGGNDYYGLIAEMVLSGYIEGSKVVGSDIEGGTIKIGKQDNGTYAFEVHEDGTVTMGGGSKIGDYTVDDIENAVGSAQESANKVQEIQGMVDEINSKKMYSVRIESSGPLIMRNKDDTTTLKCIVESWGTDVTQELIENGATFKWIRTSNNQDDDNTWNDNSEHQGKTEIIIGIADIAYNATFSCEVEVQEDG